MNACYVYITLYSGFPFGYWKRICFALAALHDRLKHLKTHKFAHAVCISYMHQMSVKYFGFWLRHCSVSVFCDWLTGLLWFWFYNTQNSETRSTHVIINIQYLLIITSTGDNMALQLTGVVSTWQLAATCSSTREWLCWWTWQRTDL